MRRWIGRWIVAVGVLHSALGVVVFRSTLGAMAAEGLWDSMGQDRGRQLGVWFLTGGFALLLTGTLVDALEREGRDVPRVFAWGLLAVAMGGIVVSPRSGFLSLLPPAIGAVMRTRARRRATSSPHAEVSVHAGA